MIELERHIEILLLDNDCVIVPELGGFMAHYVEARYDEQDGQFLPPMRSLGFNPKLRLNDSLLVQSYIEAYDISYPEAVRRIDEEVNEVRQHLDNEGCYDLNDIGRLFLNDNGNVEFTPCEAGILTPALYGLNTVDVDLLSDMEKETAKRAQVVEIDNEAQKVITDDNHITVKLSVVRNAIAIAAALLLFFLISTPLGNDTNKSASLGNLNTEMLLKVMPKAVNIAEEPTTRVSENTKNEGVTGNKQDVAQAAPVKVSTTSSQTASASSTQSVHLNEANVFKGKWCLVLVSHVPYENAVSYVAKLQQEGLSGLRVLTFNSGAKVVYGAYASQEEAYADLRNHLSEKPFKHAWLFEQK